MKDFSKAALAALVIAVLLTGCSPKAETGPTPTVSAGGQSVDPTPAPPKQEGTKALVFKLVGERAEITVGTTGLRGSAYYTGDGKDTMVFPLAETAKALGWNVTEQDASGPAEVRISRDGMPEVVIRYERPGSDKDASIEDAEVSRGAEKVNVGDKPFAYIDGLLHATEAFFDHALQEIEIRYDGAKKIMIEAKA